MTDRDSATLSLSNFISPSISLLSLSTQSLSLTASALQSFTTPAITVPFPAGYGQTQIPFALAYSQVYSVSDVATIGGIRPSGSSVSTSTPQTEGEGWPKWATPVIAAVSAFLAVGVLAGIWLCVRKKREDSSYGKFVSQVEQEGVLVASNRPMRVKRKGNAAKDQQKRAIKEGKAREREKDGVAMPNLAYGHLVRGDRQSSNASTSPKAGGKKREKEKDDWGYIDFHG